jgi:putative tributyrin esterase
MPFSRLAASRVRTIEVSDPAIPAEGLSFLTFYSPALDGRGDVTVFAPPPKSEHPIPVVLMLHGVYGSHWSWFLQGDAHHTAIKLTDAGRIRPMLLAAPSDGLFQDGSGYLRHSGQDFEAWIVEDVLEGLRASFPCIGPDSPLFITGLSIGGYGALRLGAKHVQLFRGISAHSAITRIEEMSDFVLQPFPFNQSTTRETDLLGWMSGNWDKLPPLRFDCGTRDPLLKSNQALHRELQARMIPHEYAEFEGEHNWEYWRTNFASSLLFFEDILTKGEEAR